MSQGLPKLCCKSHICEQADSNGLWDAVVIRGHGRDSPRIPSGRAQRTAGEWTQPPLSGQKDLLGN